MSKLFLSFLFVSQLALTLLGQTAKVATTSPQKPITETLYQNATELSQHLYNGQRYHIYDSRSKDHQFFQVEDWRLGSFDYDGQHFENIPIMYDIVKDLLVIYYQGRSGLIQLQSERVSRFSYIDHHFVRIEQNKVLGTTVPTGFYDFLYDGKTKVVARWTKQRQEQIESNRVNVYFLPKNFFYIQKEGEFHLITSKKSALALFGEHKKELKKHLREKRIKFRKNREEALVTIAKHYDQLVHP
ncbi:hypothetical protein [Runella limosa]|uniref:hypothetical protein n=1 Tax=Runella limosa TaxID=370978 RepID=UPI0003F6E393|nr:hypothetical protein [Runella limosa]